MAQHTNPDACEGVLIVEDDESIRAALAQALEDDGYVVFTAGHGGEALALLRQQRSLPCVVLLDMMMPVMDGRAFLEEKAKDPALAPVPVIIVTADGRTLREAASLNARQVLAKPISLETLLEAVGRFARRS